MKTLLLITMFFLSSFSFSYDSSTVNINDLLDVPISFVGTEFTKIDTDYKFQPLTQTAINAIESSPAIETKTIDMVFKFGKDSVILYKEVKGFCDGGDEFITVDNLVDLYNRYCMEMGIDPNLLLAQAYHESRFIPTAKSPTNATGWAQFIKSTWRYITGLDITERVSVSKSIMAQCKYMYLLLQETNGSWENAMYRYLGSRSKSYTRSILNTYYGYINDNTQ